jgi:hypothetical protein
MMLFASAAAHTAIPATWKGNVAAFLLAQRLLFHPDTRDEQQKTEETRI